MLISIIIPVYKDFERLEKCIKSIDDQGLDKRLFEVVVVNNDVDEDLPPLRKHELSLKVLNCQKEGSYAARNKGAKIANGDYIAFIDSDCIPDDTWLATVKSIIENNPEADLIAGNVILYPMRDTQPNPYEAYDMILGIDQSSYAKKKKSVTANLVVRKSSFVQLQGFDESRFTGGDHEFCDRARELGYKFLYAPDSVVYHPARSSMSQIVGKAERRIGGRVGNTSLKNIKQILITLLPPFVRFNKVIKANQFSWKEKKEVIKLLFIVKKYQIKELYKLLMSNKKSVR
ncbi:glycosyltransferase family 2 protein [Halomonas sp. GXIMD04776]|uniref:glycosyltransferase family 2 protein n=1 Tax=Halomonas sp. GXIMD04776 TaxID=3415605 RepID=UPI003CB7442A